MAMVKAARASRMLGVLFSCMCGVVWSEPTTGHRTSLSVMGRTAYVYRPERAFSTGPVPAIFVLHGSDDVPSSFFNVGFEPLADAHDFLVVYPEMQVPRSDDWGYESDMAYFKALHQRLQDDFAMDGSRAFVCGHSAGGTMSLFLQNEMDIFQAAASIEAAPEPWKWHLNRTGHRSMIIYNHADPVLREFAPQKSLPKLLNFSVATLRRQGSKKPLSSRLLYKEDGWPSAELTHYPQDAAPELWILKWFSDPGTHEWPTSPKFSFNAAKHILKFFFEDQLFTYEEKKMSTELAKLQAKIDLERHRLWMLVSSLVLLFCFFIVKGLQWKYGVTKNLAEPLLLDVSAGRNFSQQCPLPSADWTGLWRSFSRTPVAKRVNPTEAVTIV